MGKSCPNPHSAEWQALVNKNGLDGAIKEFIQNDYEVPVGTTVELSPKRLGDRYVFNGNAITQKLNQNPQLAKKVLDKLQELYPEVRVSYEGMFDETGNWIQVPPGKRGMHIRNAFVSAVAYSNEAIIETLPHEFAHEYIQMYRNHPLVRKALDGKSEEELATELGKHFAQKETQSWFKNLIDNVMYLVRKTFGDPQVSEVLANNFYSGRKLGQKATGEGYISYQKSTGAKKRLRGAMSVDSKINRINAAESFIKDDLIKQQYGDKVAGLLNQMTDKEGVLDIDGFYRFLDVHVFKTNEIKLGRQKKGEQVDYNHVELDSNRVGDFKRFIGHNSMNPNHQNLKLLEEYLRGDLNLEIQSDDFKKQVRTLFAIHQSIGFWSDLETQNIKGYGQAIEDKLYAEDGKLVSLKEVSERIQKEFDDNLNKRNKFFTKLSDKIPSSLSFIKNFDFDRFMPWLYDGYLLAKALTGKSDSTFADAFYYSLDAAGSQYQETQNKFKEIFSVKGKENVYSNWGTADRSNGDINSYETYEVELANGEKVKLTKSEATTLFLMLSQNDSYKAIQEHGFYLDELIKGRDIRIDQALKLSTQARSKIIKDFTTNQDFMDAVNSTKNSMNYLFERVKSTYIHLNGNELEERENYFPAYYGKSPIDQRTEKNTLEQFRSSHARSGGAMPVRIGDFKKVAHNHAVASGMYGAYTLPVRNNRKILASFRHKYQGSEIERKLNHVEGYLKKLEDPTMLYSSQGEKKLDQSINKIMSNFSVFALGYNPFVVIKQTASYQALSVFIPKKHLKAAGYKIGPLLLPDLAPYFKALTNVKSKEDADIIQKLLPLKYRLDDENELYAEMKKWSAKLQYRFEGHTDRELSEALMSMSKGDDKIEIKIPGSKKSIFVSKTRAMEGIRVMDAVTVMGAWQSVKSWTNEKIANGELNMEIGSDEYFEHVAVEAEFYIARTQPTSDIINRSPLSTSKNPISRGLTMFTSATQKIGQLMIGSVIDYNNNPTEENLKAMASTFGNAVLTTAIFITALDMIRAMMYGYMDDEEDYVDFAWHNTINNMAGYFHVFGGMIRNITSRLDNQPWQSVTQHPIEALLDDFADGTSNLFKGNFGKAFGDYLEIFFKTKGIPMTPIKAPKNIYKNWIASDPLTSAELNSIPEYVQDVKIIDNKYKSIKKDISNSYTEGSPDYNEAVENMNSERRAEKSEVRKAYQ